MKSFVAGVLLVVVAALGITAAAQTDTTKLNWALRLNETRGPVRAVDLSTPLGKTASSEILGGPSNGSDNAYLIYTRMPSGAHGPALFTLGVDHLYFVLSGRMNVQIGTDKFVAGPNTGVIIPPGVPHEVWNADAEPEAHLEVIAPATSRDLMSMLKPAQPRKVEHADQYIREVPVLAAATLKPGLNGQQLTSRAKGTAEQMRIDNVLPGAGGPKPHVHKFEQVYFIKEGTTTVMYGLETYKASANSIVIIQPGVVHTNHNEGTAVERHVTLLLPEPTEQPFDVEFEMKGPANAR